MHIHTLTHTHGLAHPSVCQWGACCPGRDTQGLGDTGKDTRLEGRRDGREEGGEHLLPNHRYSGVRHQFYSVDQWWMSHGAHGKDSERERERERERWTAGRCKASRRCCWM